MGSKYHIKRKDLPRCPDCDVKPRWGHHYCQCPKCGQGVCGTVDATRQDVGRWWIEFVINAYQFKLYYLDKKLKEEQDGK